MTKSAAKSGGIVLLICYIGFVSLGLPDALIGIAWPSVRETFALKQSDVSWIFFGVGCSYFLSSFFTGKLLQKMGVGMLLAASSALVGLAMLDFGLARAWMLFAAGSLIHGLGSGAIDTGLNHYVATHFSARHMNWLHACYSLGAMLGPLLMTALITWRGAWRSGYLIVGATLFTLAVLFLLTRGRWGDDAHAATAKPAPGPATSAFTVLALGAVRLQMLVFFIYTGFEVALGQWSYTILTEGRGVEPKVAGLWVSLYWGSILAGRIGFGFILERISLDALIRLSSLVSVLAAALFAWDPFYGAAAISLAAAGLGLAVIFPCLMTRTPQRLGKEAAAHAIGFQVGAAMLGAAALPSAAGFVAQGAGLRAVPAVMLLMASLLFVLHEILVRTTTPEPSAKVTA